MFPGSIKLVVVLSNRHVTQKHWSVGGRCALVIFPQFDEDHPVFSASYALKLAITDEMWTAAARKYFEGPVIAGQGQQTI